MIPEKKAYQQYAKRRAKKSPVALDCLKAFIFGGAICCLAQGFFDLYQMIGVPEENGKLLTSMTIIFITAVLTGLNLFEKIAKHAGAGTLVPISGFANAVVSEAMDCRSEGLILGVGAKIFTVAGPVILYGTLTSVLYGVIYWGVERWL